MAKIPAIPGVLMYDSDRFTVVGIDEADTTDLCYEIVDKETQTQTFLYGIAAQKFHEVCIYWRDVDTPSVEDVEATLENVMGMGSFPLRVH